MMAIVDDDKNGFMTTINKLDTSKGLDIILYTPGGDIAATESLIDYLDEKFNGNMRAIVPQLAMSGSTVIACACKENLERILCINRHHTGVFLRCADGATARCTMSDPDLESDLFEGPITAKFIAETNGLD